MIALCICSYVVLQGAKQYSGIAMVYIQNQSY